MLRRAIRRRGHDRSSLDVIRGLLRSQNAVENSRSDVSLAAVMRNLHNPQAVEIETHGFELSTRLLKRRHTRVSCEQDVVLPILKEDDRARIILRVRAFDRF